MNRLLAAIAARRLRKEGEAGQGLAEYALILTFIALACVVALSALGISISTSPGFTALPSAL